MKWTRRRRAGLLAIVAAGTVSAAGASQLARHPDIASDVNGTGAARAAHSANPGKGLRAFKWVNTPGAPKLPVMRDALAGDLAARTVRMPPSFLEMSGSETASSNWPRMGLPPLFLTTSRNALPGLQMTLDGGTTQEMFFVRPVFPPVTVGSAPLPMPVQHGSRSRDPAAMFSAPATAARAADRPLLSLSSIPEPQGWMLVLCGLFTVLFIARRKSALPGL